MKLPGGMNIQGMMKQAQQMQARLQEEIAADPRGGLGGRRHGDRASSTATRTAWA